MPLFLALEASPLRLQTPRLMVRELLRHGWMRSVPGSTHTADNQVEDVLVLKAVVGSAIDDCGGVVQDVVKEVVRDRGFERAGGLPRLRRGRP